MYMSSYTNEDDFDREIARKMPLGDLVAQIECPVLVGIGEFDELTRLEEAIASFERIKAPKELRVYEDEYHRLGGVAAEIIRFGGEWLELAMSGDLAEPGRDVRHFVCRDGSIREGTADPVWWLDAVSRKLRSCATDPVAMSGRRRQTIAASTPRTTFGCPSRSQ